MSDSVNSLDIAHNHNRLVTGRDCFSRFYDEFKSKIFNNNVEYKEWSHIKVSEIEESLRNYNLFYISRKSDLSHYFRTLYHIIKFVDKSNIKNKKQYISITRAQLSSYEQILIFYNCLHKNGNKKFKPLLEKYSVLKNIDDDLLINLEHKKEYNSSAYNYI
ncbi:putative phage abortive infection protein [Polaribacter sp.]|uniref:putative phage abortive infection protein n=1 Tax=Polaribacter sp. TaxID=1920175 RepID=UPI003F6C9D2E